MIGLKTAEDYYKKGHIYLSSTRERDLEAVFQFIENMIKDALNKGDIVAASSWLDTLDAYLSGAQERTFNNPKITEYAERWFRGHIDLIKMVCGRARDGLSRESPLLLLIKYLPRLGRREGVIYQDLIDVYILIFHTLRFPETYKFYLTDEGKLEERDVALRIAVRGAYRYDAGWLLEKWLSDSYLIEFKDSLAEEAKEPYREILEKEAEAYIDIKNKGFDALLFLLFSNGLEIIRWKLLDDEKRDVVHETFTKNKGALEDRFKARINEIIEFGKERDVFSFELWEILKERMG